jgi:hypothetical protein
MNVLGADEVENALKGGGDVFTLLNANCASESTADAASRQAPIRGLESG